MDDNKDEVKPHQSLHKKARRESEKPIVTFGQGASLKECILDSAGKSRLKSRKLLADNGQVFKAELSSADNDVDLVSILQDYFQLSVDVVDLYHQWSKVDPYFRKISADFGGIRILRQDPVENLFSFICSSNNNIARISSLVDKLCISYGQPIAEVDGKMYHRFPLISSLAEEGVEENLRKLGFGYRAKYIANSAKYIINNHGEEWVSSLRQCSYDVAKTELLKLCGVGEKVADCVCLMSLDKTDAVPVDTHVWQFTAQHYLPTLKEAKSVTGKLYQEIGNHFRVLWGEYAGWAQSVLFTAELRQMQGKKSAPDCAQNKKRRAQDTKVPVSSMSGASVVKSKCGKLA